MRAWMAGLGLAIILAAPAGAQPTEVTFRPCRGATAESRQACEATRRMFPEDLRKARAGDYQAQRNVAFMLSGAGRPENSAIVPNRLESCAWRLVILQSGHRRVNVLDAVETRTSCDPIDAPWHQAEARAVQLHATIQPQPPAPVRPARQISELPRHCQDIFARNSVARPIEATATPLEPLPAECRP